MRQSIKQFIGHKLGATDGEIGQVKDFYFDDQSWAVRYVYADTGSWLPGQQVLLSPLAFGHLHPVANVLRAQLTRKQIEDSPSVELHKPVSRQYEEAYHRYYGWPYYWEGDGLWGGMRGFPILDTPLQAVAAAQAPVTGAKPARADAHLRSTQAVNGYHLAAKDGTTGHVCDFVMDDQSWAIVQLVIKTGHRFTGKEVVIPVNAIDRISYEESTVFVTLTKEAVENSPVFTPATA